MPNHHRINKNLAFSVNNIFTPKKRHLKKPSENQSEFARAKRHVHCRQGILEKTLKFVSGEWLLSSCIATGIEIVPIFIKADNAEEEMEKYLKNNTQKRNKSVFSHQKKWQLN
jgi:hypothetical protein